MHKMNKPDPILEFLKTLPEATEVWTEDELKMSTPFSDVAAWEKIILHQFELGKQFLRGPPGLWETMALQWSSTTGRKIPLPPST